MHADRLRIALIAHDAKKDALVTRAKRWEPVWAKPGEPLSVGEHSLYEAGRPSEVPIMKLLSAADQGSLSAPPLAASTSIIPPGISWRGVQKEGDRRK
ncbi:MAG: hypothetical protein JWR10_353 [Rubritepida sp.]|nr:hypothetical protein [Rubritepida sp.]